MKESLSLFLLGCFCLGSAVADDGWQRDQRSLLTKFNNMYNPCVVETGGEYRFRMWFFGWATEMTNPDVPGCDAIYHARSKDLGTWEVYCKGGSWDTTMTPLKWSPVLHASERWYEAWHVGDPSVVFKDGKFYMAYSATSEHFSERAGYPSTMVQCIMGAVSKDGIHWEKTKQPLLIRKGDSPDPKPEPDRIGDFHRPCLRWEDNRWKLWFDYWLPGSGACMGFAENERAFTLRNGFKVQHDLKQPLLKDWPNPEIVRVGGTYYSFSDAPHYPIELGESRWKGRQLREAVSSDGLSWKKLDFIAPDDDADACHVPQALAVEMDGKEWLYLFYATQIGSSKNDGQYHYQYDRIRAMRRPIIAQQHVQGADDRPNIIFMLADDLRADAVGYSGNEVVQTPNIDKLANGGVVFERAFVTTPICAVSRASILSGQYAIHNGVDDFTTQINLAKSYPSVLKRNGYYTGFMGKWGVDARNMDYLAQAAESFDFWAGCSHQSNFFHEEECHWVTHDGIHNKADSLCDCPADKGGRKGEDIRTGFANMKNPIHLETVVFPRKMKAFLEARDQAKPFCMSISYKSPHGPWQDWDRRYAKLHKGQQIPMKPTATLEAALAQPQFLQDTLESDRARDWMERGVFNSWYQHYYRLIAGMDNSIGQICKLLKEHGVADNTVIIFMGDNGHFMGEHGLSGKWLLFEESIQVPLFIYDPRLPEKKRGAVSSEIALNVDIYPTIAELAGIKAPNGLQGSSLVPLFENPEKELRDGSFFEHHFTLGPPHEIVQSEGYRSKDWKYIRYTELDPVVEQLFNLKDDLLEEHDLSGNPEYKTTLAEYRGRWEKSRKLLR